MATFKVRPQPHPPPQALTPPAAATKEPVYVEVATAPGQGADASDRGAVAFRRLDLKGDGVVDSEEMRTAFRALRLSFTPAQVADLFHVADEDRDGVVSREEFARFSLRFPSIQRLRAAEGRLAAERAEEERLTGLLRDVRRRARELEQGIAEQRAASIAQLQRRPALEQQQRQLIDHELALAHQREQLRAQEDDMRRGMQLHLALRPDAPPPAAAGVWS
eukprot:gene20805-9368_t